MDPADGPHITHAEPLAFRPATGLAGYPGGLPHPGIFVVAYAMETIEDLLWSYAVPPTRPLDRVRWTIRTVLGVTPNDNPRQHVGELVIQRVTDYEAQDLPSGAKLYLDPWCAARRDLQVDAVIKHGVARCETIYLVPTKPETPLPWWLYNTVLGLDAHEVPGTTPTASVSHYSNVLRGALRCAQGIRFPQDPTLDNFHRRRYLVLRFCMDAYLHWV